MTYRCSGCGTIFRTLPTVTYSNGSGGSMTGPTGCTNCAAGRDSIFEVK